MTNMTKKPISLLLRADCVSGEHVHCTLFVGSAAGARANAGSLCLRMGEYQLFGAALCLGAAQTGGHLKVEHDEAILQLDTDQGAARPMSGVRPIMAAALSAVAPRALTPAERHRDALIPAVQLALRSSRAWLAALPGLGLTEIAGRTAHDALIAEIEFYQAALTYPNNGSLPDGEEAGQRR